MKDTWLGRLIKWIFSLYCCVAVSGCAARSTAPVAHGVDESKQKEFNEKLNNAIETAKKNGQTDINLYLDENGVSEEKTGQIQAGDLVEFNFTLATESGLLLKTNVMAEAAKRNKEGRTIPEGLDHEIKDEIYCPEPVMISLPNGGPLDISGKLIGLKPGEKKHMVLEPDKGGLPKDPAKIKPFSRFKTIPMVISLGSEDYKNQFGNDPMKGARIAVAPFVMAKVRDVKDNMAVLDVEFDKEREFKDALGRTRIMRNGDSLVMELIPEIGASFEINSVRGHVSSVDAASFYVDFNPPGAGQNIVLDVEIVSLVKASQVGKDAITWVTDYKKGLETMKQTGKPMVLFLYREGCPWCSRMEAEVLPNPMIRTMNRDYVWVKINSEKQHEIKDMFKQEGFPMTVLMNKDQTVYGDLKGFRDARKMRKELRLWNEDLKAGKSVNTHETIGASSADECRG